MENITFDRPVAEIPKDGLLQAFGGIIKYNSDGVAIGGMAGVTRAIIMNELEFPSDTAQRDLRDIWYSSVKPVFDKIGYLVQPRSSTTSESGFIKGRVDKLSIYVEKFVSQGLFKYSDLNVLDHSRPARYAMSKVKNPMPNYYVSFGIYPHIVLATEKDTQYAELQAIAELYGCSAISGTGQNAFAATERLFYELERRKCYAVFFLTFTDWDAAGVSIADTFYNQMKRIVAAQGSSMEVHKDRFGIELFHLTKQEIEENKFSLPNTTENINWVEEGGGVDGEMYGVELNALKHKRRVEIITDGLKYYIKPELYKEIMPGQYIKKIALESISEVVDKVLNEVVEEFEEEITAPEITPALLQKMALNGEVELPIEDCSHERDAAIAKAMITKLGDRI